jgi:RNA polymerase sigma factor (sigma-70 family)
MFDKSLSSSLIWDFAVADSVDESQRWILSAMQRHGQELVTMLWRILGNEQDVCDAYQSAFLRLAHGERGRKPRHLKAYIFRTASNVAVSMLRRRIVERKGLSVVVARESRVPSSSDVGPDRSNSPANAFDAKYLQETLRVCLARLPEHLRDVIALHDLAELPYRQVGRILSISPATARVYRCKAIRLLAVWMNSKERE